jgi:2-polyprenyl-3-methyl-5-hydroxy-6-metoxy-1,4-benzoquinol methylase
MTETKIEKRRTNSTCPGCRATDMVQFGPMLLKCNACGLAYYPEAPDAEALAELYGEQYFHGEEYHDYVAQRPALDANFRRRLQSVQAFLGPSAGVVELGCAYGFFLAMVADRVAWHVGFDVSRTAVEYARRELGVNATTDSFLDWEPSQPVSMVVMWDFVEHVGNPEAFLAKAASILDPGGHIVLTTGDIAALIPRIRGLRWRMIHPPTHVYYFTIASLSSVLERHGMRVVRVRHPAVWRNARAMLEQVVHSRPDGPVAKIGRSVAQSRVLDRIDLPLNLWDVMEVVAQKVR